MTARIVRGSVEDRGPKPQRWVETFDGNLADAGYHPHSEPDPFGAAAFNPDIEVADQARWNTAGLDTIGEPGTNPLPLRDPRTGYRPVIDTVSPTVTGSRTALPTYSVALNRLLHLAPVSRYARPRAALYPEAPPRGDPRNQMRPQGIFPNTVTDWPQARPSYRTFRDWLQRGRG